MRPFDRLTLVDIGCGGGIVVLAQGQSQLNLGIDIARINADRLSQLANGFLRALQLCQRKAEVVVRFGQIGIAHDRALEFLQPSRLISRLPKK